MQSVERGSWTGHVGFILAAAGSAIGLGNIWMFPFRAGLNGGAAFVLVYLAAVVALGIPLMVAEVLIGRATRRNPVGAMRTLRPGSAWQLVGWLGVVAGFVILSYYGVVAGWALGYVWYAASGTLSAAGADGIQSIFSDLIANGPLQVFLQACFMGATILVVSGGVEAGIERASKVLMPALLLLILLLLGYSLTSAGALEGLEFLLRPRFEELGSEGVLAALGQAFFSLSLGMGAMITYGSYLEKDHSVPRAAFLIAAMDTAMAILAGLVIFPLVFTFGLEPTAGPGLVFLTLPKAFLLMPAGQMLGTMFFSLLLFAALTSAISLLEVVVAFMVDELGWSRAAASWGAGGLIFLLGIPSAVVSGFLDEVDGLASNWMLPIGGLFIALFTGWVLGEDESRSGYGREVPGFGAWRAAIRYFAPLAVGIILAQSSGVFG
jgi:NSS family neurotransmitter:Na+ symporter